MSILNSILKIQPLFGQGDFTPPSLGGSQKLPSMPGMGGVNGVPTAPQPPEPTAKKKGGGILGQILGSVTGGGQGGGGIISQILQMLSMGGA